MYSYIQVSQYLSREENIFDHELYSSNFRFIRNDKVFVATHKDSISTMAFGIINFATWTVFILDKVLAIAGWTRVPEVVLHTFGLAGGGVGGVFGMLSAWHKIRKTKFLITFAASSVGGILGKEFLRQFANITADHSSCTHKSSNNNG